MLQRLLLVFLAMGLVACSALPFNAIPPTVSVADVDIKSIGLFEQHFDVGVRLSNPNDFNLKIEALEFELALNGRAFAKGLSRVAAWVPATSSTVIRVDAITQSRNLLQQIKTLPSETLKVGVPYRITGRVKTDKSSRWLPFDHTGVVGGDEKKAKGRAV